VGDDITLGPRERGRFLAALAQAFRSPTRVQAVLDEIEFPLANRPYAIAGPQDLWREVFLELDGGALAGGYRKLLVLVRVLYPANQTFAELAAAHLAEPATPGAPEPQPGPGPEPADSAPQDGDAESMLEQAWLADGAVQRVHRPAAGAHPASGVRDVEELAAASPPQASRQWRRRLTVTVHGDAAYQDSRELAVSRRVAWQRDQGEVETRIRQCRTALEAFRQKHGAALEAIDPDDLRARLDAYVRHLRAGTERHRWGRRDAADAAARERWAALATSPELRQLAHAGHRLAQTLFPARDADWDALRALEPGDRLELTWQVGSTPWVPRLPLGLTYLSAPPAEGEPVDPMGFLGLRLRLGYRAYPMADLAPTGDWALTTRAHALYWGADPNDAVAREAARHRAELSRWSPAVVTEPGSGSRADLLRLVREPGGPLSLLYFYCLCKTGPGTDPVLRFGGTNAAEHVVRLDELAGPELPGNPVLFMNACDSSAADPFLGNELERLFTDRRARCYVGTESKVPAGLAARFATTVFAFLYDAGAWRAETPVSEAIAQARLFLWEEFRSLGGLFYSQVNDPPLTHDDRRAEVPG
jgi:hypothetical protein